MNGTIEVSRNPQIRIVPDLTGVHLVYKLILHLSYTMFLCVSRDSNGVRIMYHWQGRGRHFITAPYFDSKSRESVWCYKPVDITDAVNSRTPITAVEKKLGEIGYRDDRFLWMMIGTQQNFELSEPMGELFWRERDTEAAVQLTDNKAFRVMIKFEQF